MSPSPRHRPKSCLNADRMPEQGEGKGGCDVAASYSAARVLSSTREREVQSEKINHQLT